METPQSKRNRLVKKKAPFERFDAAANKAGPISNVNAVRTTVERKAKQMQQLPLPGNNEQTRASCPAVSV